MLFELAGICKTYRTRDGGHEALSDVNLKVDAGEVVGLIGASGSGKTTLASIALGLETADKGMITFDGESCDASLPRRRRPRAFRQAALGMQLVFQHPAASFSERMRVGEAVAEGVAYRGIARYERERMALEQIKGIEVFLEEAAELR